MDGSLEDFWFTTFTDGADQLDFPDPTVLIRKNFYYATHWPKTFRGVFFEEHYVIDPQVGRGLSPFAPGL